tara:strand:+ start:181494 stop:181754 length:261 start_codon:yes stop_codon:yes gene_type:complete
MKIFLFSVGIMGVALFGMAIGVILSNRKLKGSCGGLGALMGEDCMFCEKKEQCEKKKAGSGSDDDLGQKPLKVDADSNTVHLRLVK